MFECAFDCVFGCVFEREGVFSVAQVERDNNRPVLAPVEHSGPQVARAPRVLPDDPKRARRPPPNTSVRFEGTTAMPRLPPSLLAPDPAPPLCPSNAIDHRSTLIEHRPIQHRLIERTTSPRSGRTLALFVTFLVSAAFHELLIGVPCHMLRLWSFTGIMAQSAPLSRHYSSAPLRRRASAAPRGRSPMC